MAEERICGKCSRVRARKRAMARAKDDEGEGKHKGEGEEEDLWRCKDCGNEKFYEEGCYRCAQCEFGYVEFGGKGKNEGDDK